MLCIQPKRLLFCFVLFVSAWGSASQALAQGERPIWQLSGVVIRDDTTTNGIYGVHIYNPKSGRGTTSDYYGYFSLPVMNGDSLVVSAIGYQREGFRVSKYQDRDFSVLIRLKEDTTLLPEITIFPYPTEMAFKRAVLALQLPFQTERGIVKANLDHTTQLARMEALEMGAAGNHRWFMNQYNQTIQRRFGPPANPLLNPFAWGQFIRSLKEDDD